MSVSLIGCPSNTAEKESSKGSIWIDSSHTESVDENKTDISNSDNQNSSSWTSTYVEDDPWIHYENLSFSYRDEKIVLGQSTLQDMIDGNVPFVESYIKNADSEYVTSLALYGTIPIQIDDAEVALLFLLNDTMENQLLKDCLVAGIQIVNINLLEDEWVNNNELVFAFPYILAIEELLENGGDYIYKVDYEFGYDTEQKGYRFTFTDGKLSASQMMLLNMY